MVTLAKALSTKTSLCKRILWDADSYSCCVRIDLSNAEARSKNDVNKRFLQMLSRDFWNPRTVK